MIFAALDYLAYLRGRGRYHPENIPGPMAVAWEDAVPEWVLSTLPSGTILATATPNSFGAWAIMYGTRSNVSHVAIYMGDGRIGHTAPGGTRIEAVTALFGPGRRILPFVPDALLARPPRRPINDVLEGLEGRPYGYAVIARKAVAIVTGRWWPLFRPTLFLDFLLLTFAIDALAWTYTGAGLPWLTIAYATIVLINGVRWVFQPIDLIWGEGAGWPELVFVALGPGQIVGDAMKAGTRPWPGASFFRPRETPEG